MKKRIIIIALSLPCLFTLQAQEKWSLPKCINYAIENSLTVKQQETEKLNSEVGVNTAKWSRLPNLNGNVGQSFNYGRALQSNNTYEDRNTKNSSFSLSTNVPLFTGMNIPNNIAMSKLNLKAAMEDLQKAKEDISIQVASYYTQILYNKELSKIANNQVSLSEEQLKLKEAYFNNGKASEAEVYEAKARVAQDKMSAVQADNNCSLSILELTQLLELPTPDNFDIVVPDIEDNFASITLPDVIYNEIVLSKPSVKAAQFRLQGAEKGIRIAQSEYYPQLSFQAGIGTNYYEVSDYENASFGSQWHRNMSKYFGFNLSVPIFNRFTTRNRVKQAKIQKMSFQWKLEQTKKELYKEIQQAYYNAIASESKYKSSNVAVQAAEASFKLMSEKYANGKANATEYNEVRTNMLKALSDKVQAKYEYLFRTKVLDFYKGIPLDM